jgi:hydroxymethylglutaryl-CoA lyase
LTHLISGRGAAPWRVQGLPRKVNVVEVGPRDGFQMESTFIPTELKVRIINKISDSGVRKIEASSFVNPSVIPQMGDAGEVFARIKRRLGVIYTALVPNQTGAIHALGAQVDAMRVVICASESYNQRNVRMTILESLMACEAILGVASSAGRPAEAIIALAFGCPLEGEIPPEKVVGLVRRLVKSGYSEISIADSVGLANPLQVRTLMARLREGFPEVHFSLHLHDTRGMGLANALAALEVGIDTFDSSIGGLGGCPVVSGGTGNISTEDLVHMLDEMGIETGVDVEGVMEASRLAQDFLQRQLPSCVLAAGTRKQLYRRIKTNG